ncbi:MAG: 4-(cytidine 5'-diphospho)-2-C-methyl-D-erythritol kinase [Proteobacteria bacterium]|nr:4-(cytidine 5'-diphospho)-2-C-methyl-D-erythritol kinase [Pseudomonadota bacterium]
MIYCNAKLNLYLKVVGKREDGYHLLNMINVPISIYDRMEIDIKEGEGRLIQKFEPPVNCIPEKTTIYRAFQIMKKFLPEDINIVVNIEKVIPEGSGLGGGSSDSAFFIKKLAEVFKIEIDNNLIFKIANQVGADVPFFIFNKPAYLEGIGEMVYPYKSFPALNFLVIKPDFSINTGWAYSNVRDFSLPNDTFKQDYIKAEDIFRYMENDLEKIAEGKFFEIKKIKNFLYNNDAKKAMMTGSGSAVFGIFEKEDVIKDVFLEAKKTFPEYKIFKAHTIGA